MIRPCEPTEHEFYQTFDPELRLTFFICKKCPVHVSFGPELALSNRPGVLILTRVAEATRDWYIKELES